MILYSPSMWAWVQQQESVPVDERCVNENAYRSDGTICRDRAEAHGWCSACWAEIVP